MKDFILTYWRQILDCASILFCVTFFILKKKPINFIDSKRSEILEWLPGAICAAEKSGLKGEDKVLFVLKVLYDFMFPKFTISYDEFLNIYETFIRSHLEAILTTPQKKGE